MLQIVARGYYIIHLTLITLILSKMKTTILFYPLNRLVIAGLIGLLGLTACTKQPVKPSKKSPDLSDTAQVIERDADGKLPSERLQLLSPSELKLQASLSAEMQDWTTYIQLNTHLWQQLDDDNRAQIEYEIWERLRQVDKKTIESFKHHSDPGVQAWGLLLSILNGPVQQIEAGLSEIATNRTANNDRTAIYQNNLLIELQQKLSNFVAVKQIAVLLPFQGRYEQVSKQIQTGMLKAFLASDQSTLIKFYDSYQLDRVEAIYRRAKLEGADFVIGPLRKEALEQLAHIKDPNILALNKVEATDFYQFSFKSADEVSQMIALFNQHNYRHIGILTSDRSNDVAKAEAIQQAWQVNQQHSATLSIYPDADPKLRDALGTLINEDTSQTRYNNLRWATGRSLSYFPRTRQDFDAIVILDNRNRVAVFKPQFAFFQLKVPVYGSSQLSPVNLLENRAYPDLKGVKFLTHPYVLSPAELETQFEAYGWDSFQLVSQLNKMRLGAVLESGKTGILSLNARDFTQKLVWAQYDKKGLIEPMPPVAPSADFTEPKADTSTETQTDTRAF